MEGGLQCLVTWCRTPHSTIEHTDGSNKCHNFKQNLEDFCSVSNSVLSHMIKWLVLNLDKTNIMKFITNNSSHATQHIGYKEKYRKETVESKFLGLQNDNHLNWKNHIEQMIPS